MIYLKKDVKKDVNRLFCAQYSQVYRKQSNSTCLYQHSDKCDINHCVDINMEFKKAIEEKLMVSFLDSTANND